MHDARIVRLCQCVGDLHEQFEASRSGQTTEQVPERLSLDELHGKVMERLTLNLRFTSGAIGSYTAAYPELEVPSEPNELRLYGTEAVMTLGKAGIQIHRPDRTIATWRVEQPDGGYFNEFRNFHEALVDGAPVVGTVAQSYRNMELVLGGIVSAREGRIFTIDPCPAPLSVSAVPLWRPNGAADLFGDLPTKVTREIARVN